LVIRHLLSILALPFTVSAIVPLWLARRNGIGWSVPSTPLETGAVVLGAASLAVGAALFATSLFWFATRGRGTLAPWDPPRHLVVEGPYRYVRNPMISGVLFVLLGEALVLRSAPHATWLAIFATANGLWIPIFEEPQLEERFGEEYRRYRQNVPRLIPRLSPWNPV
jgi:protein-S-isoprenylcysteine O-methyltransferase Ste14